MPEVHAILSASSSKRWLNCTPSARLEQNFPNESSVYAEEGTAAHALGEYKLRKYLHERVQRPTSEYENEEMEANTDIYAEFIISTVERIKETCPHPLVMVEERLDYSYLVPSGFGTGDCVIIADGHCMSWITRTAKGVFVSCDHNPQMMLYALGAVKLYRPLFGGSLKNVKFYIDQPRLNAYEGWGCSIDELLEWGESVKPIAQKAFMGFGEYAAGEWCRFCRANGLCKAQAEQQVSALDDFAGVIGNPSALLTPEQMGDVLTRGKTLVDWYEAVKENALAAILNGTKIPGYKAVEGRSSRIWTSQDAALEKLQASGIDRAVIYDSVPKTLAQLEKMLGKAKFNELVGEFVTKPQGKPALATADDTRAEFSRAASDFAGMVSNGAK